MLLYLFTIENHIESIVFYAEKLILVFTKIMLQKQAVQCLMKLQ